MKNRTSEGFIEQICLVAALLLCLQGAASGHGFINQGHTEIKQLETGSAVQREIANGESQAYQISLTAGQFVRFRLEQRASDQALVLTAPNGKQLVEMDLTHEGDQESLSLEAASSGAYQLTVRGSGTTTVRGAYRLVATATATATAQDRKRVAAEALMIEAYALQKQAGKTAQQVIEILHKTLPVWRELGEPSLAAWSLFRIGNTYYDLSQLEKALEYHEQALAHYREAKNLSGEGRAANRLGFVYIRLSRYEKAIESFEQALAIFREVKNQRAVADSVYSLGAAYLFLSSYEKTIENMEQALAIYREIKARPSEGTALNLLASAYSLLSHYEKAIECYQQALAISRESKNRSREEAALSNLGMTYRQLGRSEKAIEYIEQAVAISRDVKELRNETSHLNNLADAYHSMGRYEKAIEYLEKSLAISREVKSPYSEGNALHGLANAYYGLSRYEKAIEYDKQALAISREIKDRVLEGEALGGLGAAHNSLSRYEKAIEYLERALAIYREVKRREGEGDALKGLAEAERNRGNLLRARLLIEERLRVAESVRSDVISPESRTSYLASVQNSYQFYTDLLMHQHKAEPAKGFDALAVEVSERQRARSLLDLLAESHADVRQGVDPTLLERERLLGRQLNDKAQLLTQPNTPEQAAARKQEINQLENDYERAQAAIRKASPHYAALTQPQPLKLKEIQEQLDDDTVLLEYALGAERSYVWAITKETLASYELPKQEVIDQSARQVYELLQARGAVKRRETVAQQRQRVAQADTQLVGAAQALSQLILAPIAAQFSNKRLVIVADGALQYVPFAMLPLPETRGPGDAETRGQDSARRVAASPRPGVAPMPLIVNHEIISLPSASALAVQRAELAGRKPAPKMLAVIADPVFDRSDPRFTTPAPESDGTTPTQTIAADDTRKIEHLADKSGDHSGSTTRRLVIPRLPFTRQEATRLLALAPKTSSFSAMDFHANRQTMLNSDLSQYRYLHFATHGLLDSERPGLSSLVLSMVDAQGNQQDGFLRANDIYNLRLPAELVVLSACQTGLGKEIKGEGLVGLTRGFMYAGAARVVVSLWNVNDRATAELMAKFYEKMLKQGERPAAALRAAQVEMWKQKQWQSPYYWAGFTMQGEWR